MKRASGQEYERWELCVKAGLNINQYVGYARAQFFDDNRRFVVVKARGQAIENALKVVQLVKENMGDIHSQSKLYLMVDSKSFGHNNARGKSSQSRTRSRGKQVQFTSDINPEEDEGFSSHDTIIEDWEKYSKDKYKKQLRVLPAIEVILSKNVINQNDPGYQKPAIRIQTIFHGTQVSKVKKSQSKQEKIMRRRNLNNEFFFSKKEVSSPSNSGQSSKGFKKQKIYNSQESFKSFNSSRNQMESKENVNRSNTQFFQDESIFGNLTNNYSQLSRFSHPNQAANDFQPQRRFNDHFDNGQDLNGGIKLQSTMKRLDRHRFSVDKQLGLSLSELENRGGQKERSQDRRMMLNGPIMRGSSKHARAFGKENEENYQVKKLKRK
ncbi:UNKNOWN [Stylonychia lemnae]|uniref:DNA/RNA-binding protein Alba-like domain-containing protein n=1 Tax=Stylonychia lemnae TaxID=5949 RepID=A0A078AM86_STYLE|nr:UNKNOWN [Stylonychia lemnae]|eukprot:CDW82497.1 UNKNOWN [Stylonychia lemnae]